MFGLLRLAAILPDGCDGPSSSDVEVFGGIGSSCYANLPVRGRMNESGLPMTPDTIPRACIMGHPVAQSRSPMMHGYWLKTLGLAGAYERADVAPDDFPAFFRDLRGRSYVGGNITKPHKEVAFRLVDRREGAADTIGAVNTVW